MNRALNDLMSDLLTTNEVQDLLHVDRTTIYRLVESGRLPAIRVGKQWRFSRPEIERWLRGQVVTPAAQAGVSGAQQTEGAPPEPEQPGARCLSHRLRTADPGCLRRVAGHHDRRHRHGWTAGHPGEQSVRAVCRVLSRDEDALAGCVVHWQQMAGAVSLEPRFMPSEMGLLCARGLIRVGNELRGMVFFGGIAPVTSSAASRGAGCRDPADHFGSGACPHRGKCTGCVSAGSRHS